MKRESIVFLISGTFFGLIVGWILGSQQTVGPRPQTAVETRPAADPAAQAGRPAPPPVDSARLEQLETAARQDEKNVAVRVELGNLYFDAERYGDAIRWYEAALALNPRNVDVSTDLGVSYYYSNQPDRALQQFEHSLEVDPRHTKTMLNMGIVRAFGKQDLEGAAADWQRVVELAPDSPEGRAARQALEAMKAAHPGLTGGPGTSPGGE